MLSHIYGKPLGLFSLLLLVFSVSAESILEFHQRQCAAGNQDSCSRAEVMQAADAEADRIEQLGDAFAARIDRNDYETDNKPELGRAYVDVMQDYFKAEAENGASRNISNDMLLLCADHYHDYWRNRKLIWPTDEQQRPDWSAIYYYIVDHYYGYCVRSFLSGASNS